VQTSEQKNSAILRSIDQSPKVAIAEKNISHITVADDYIILISIIAVVIAIALIIFMHNIKLLRIVNSFNSKALEIKNDFDSLISTANKFNARSIGIKCAIVERDDIKIIRFNIEEIAIDESMLNISSESIYMMSSILSGAPSLFKDLAQEPEQEK